MQEQVAAWKEITDAVHEKNLSAMGTWEDSHF
jgi:hypothetical protein